MGSRVCRHASLSIAVVILALASCAYPHPIPPPRTVLAPAGASSEELRWAVEGALATRSWTVVDRAPGSITAFVFSRGTQERADVKINYRPGVIEIQCTKQQAAPQRYDRWVQLLATEIQKNAAQVGMAGSTPPPPPPAVPPSQDAGAATSSK
jgi:hypothetical protein